MRLPISSSNFDHVRSYRLLRRRDASRMPLLERFAACWLAGILMLLASPAEAQTITGISIPVGSHDANSRPRDSGVWSVSAPPYPLNVNTGIGYLINPVAASSGDFVLHDHVYTGAHTPDPTRAVITYRFDTAATVDQVEIQQHANGISQIEGFVGNDGVNWTSVGSVFGPSGNVTGAGVLPEGGFQVFDLNNTTSATFFRFIVRKTSLSNGWAAYRAHLRNSSGVRFAPSTGPAAPADVVPEPGALALLAPGLFAVLLTRRPLRRKG